MKPKQWKKVGYKAFNLWALDSNNARIQDIKPEEIFQRSCNVKTFAAWISFKKGWDNAEFDHEYHAQFQPTIQHY